MHGGYADTWERTHVIKFNTALFARSLEDFFIITSKETFTFEGTFIRTCVKYMGSRTNPASRANHFLFALTAKSTNQIPTAT